MDDFVKRRLAELEAAAPVKRKKAKPYAAAELEGAAKAFAALGCPKAMVYLWLVRRARMAGKRTITAPSGELAKYGVHREMKRRALKELEGGGVIMIEGRPGKTPSVTLL